MSQELLQQLREDLREVQKDTQQTRVEVVEAGAEIRALQRTLSSVETKIDALSNMRVEQVRCETRQDGRWAAHTEEHRVLDVGSREDTVAIERNRKSATDNMLRLAMLGGGGGALGVLLVELIKYLTS